ncbi:MAG: hypothetical protein WC924_03180 [Candidatus Gracilibacteria bacterium]
MDINLKSLESALKDLKELPDTAIVQQHPDASGLSEFIKERTRKAETIISDIIDLIREKATLQTLINRGDDD